MEEREHSVSILKAQSVWFAALFLSFLITGGIISIVAPRSNISTAENRALTPFPVFSVWSLFSGSYTDSLELYYADNFPLRDELVMAATSIRDLSGYHSEIIYYQADGVDPEPAVRITDSAKTAQKKTPIPVIVKSDTAKVEAEYDRSSSVVIYGNRAIQIFTTSFDAPGQFADMVNLYNATFNSLDIYCLVAPTQTDFYLPDQYKKSSNYEETVIEFVHTLLDSTVHFVDAYSELERHKKEYIYFNTDHHWTGRGAYYAYVAFCKSAGITPYPLDSLERRHVKKSFLGSLYGITLDKRLKESRDSVEYFMPPMAIRTFRWNKDLRKYEFSRLFANAHNYTNFIGGDHPMVRIESDVSTERILVIKDSYGNAVVPYLAMHYGTVYVMDYRYFDVNVQDFVRQNAITAIMFLHNTFAVNAKHTAYRGRYLLSCCRLPAKNVDSAKDTSTLTDPVKKNEP